MNAHRQRERGRSRRALAVMSLMLLLALPAPTHATGHDPILLVHGWRGDPSTFGEMIRRFEAAGRSAVAIRLPGQDNIVNARAIRDHIKSQGWSRVDIVAQSMGGLSSRYLLKSLTTSATIDTYVSLGTPQYGIWAACGLPQSGGGQMCPTSRFLRDLNRGDDTPGATFYTTIYSTDDGLVPTSASRLDGGACHVQVSGVVHDEMDNDAGVFADVLAAVDRSCAGSFHSG